MSKIRRLIKSYEKFIAIPWRSDSAPLQRVIFCVYNENEELRLRAKIDEFELVTKQSGHEWVVFDLTDTFADWLSGHRYAQKYFLKPQLISTILPSYMNFITEKFDIFLKQHAVGDNTVVAIKGVGTLFGFLKVKEVVDNLAPVVPGRILVFFPGSYEDNNYRLLDGYDGWNYLAVPITADTAF
ncbi:MAG: DUF1788 domain-containing protein [Desulfatirhabdiaceae bacterium]|nr:DUF1788 domain-containing protein [Desulfatirhabdiaceae bacterium]